MEDMPLTPEQLEALAEYQRHKDLAAGILIGGLVAGMIIFSIMYGESVLAFVANLF